MIYVLLFWEFFKIGLMAIGGGLVTIPFLIELSGKYNWFTTAELADMIAVSESTPGPIGVNMATYVGYNTCGIWGGIVATMGLVVPSLLIIMLISKWMFNEKFSEHLQRFLFGIRPAVLALILFAGAELAKMAIVNWETLAIAMISFCMMRRLKWSPIAFIALGAIVGIVLEL